jgi:hypothetical protein
MVKKSFVPLSILLLLAVSQVIAFCIDFVLELFPSESIPGFELIFLRDGSGGYMEYAWRSREKRIYDAKGTVIKKVNVERRLGGRVAMRGLFLSRLPGTNYPRRVSMINEGRDAAEYWFFIPDESAIVHGECGRKKGDASE